MLSKRVIFYTPGIFLETINGEINQEHNRFAFHQIPDVFRTIIFNLGA